VDGKADWLAHGLPREGETARIPYAGELVDPDPPSCSLSDNISVLRARIEDSRYGYCLVLGERRVVLGRVRRTALASAPEHASAEQLMEAGPSTVRPNTPVPELLERLAKDDLETAIVTTPRGCLIGVFSGAQQARGARE
jgi:Mg/Co/Ni transporter MgtE